MIVKERLESILEELFSDSLVVKFSTEWIVNSPRASEDSIKTVYCFLKGKGLKDEKIASRAELLSMNPETIERNYQRLSALGLKDDKIASQAHLLSMNPETIERNYQRLSALGLKDDKIASQAHLLGMNPETIERNYQSHIGLLRQNHQDRTSGRALLTNQAQLLGISPETINANVQFLYSMGIDYNNAFFLGTTTQLKRKKIAWILRELFDYRNLPQEQRRDSISDLYDFIRDNPRVLTKSINAMERGKNRLRERVSPHRVK